MMGLQAPLKDSDYIPQQHLILSTEEFEQQNMFFNNPRDSDEE
jgi:hypothetical protein